MTIGCRGADGGSNSMGVPCAAVLALTYDTEAPLSSLTSTIIFSMLPCMLTRGLDVSGL